MSSIDWDFVWEFIESVLFWGRDDHFKNLPVYEYALSPFGLSLFQYSNFQHRDLVYLL